MRHGKLTAEQERRVRELHNMDQAAYAVLLERVRHSLYNYDPQIADDAMQHAYERALKEFDGRVPYAHFILVVAHNYAYDEWVTNGKRQLLMSELEERDPELQALGATEDPTPGDEEISFVTEIKHALQEMELSAEADPYAGKVSSTQVARTRQVLDELVQACVAGYGPGVDEYEEQIEQVIPEGAQRRMRRTNMIEHLAAVLTRKDNARRKLPPGSKAKPNKKVGFKSVEASMTLLRQVTRPIVFGTSSEEETSDVRSRRALPRVMVNVRTAKLS